MESITGSQCNVAQAIHAYQFNGKGGVMAITPESVATSTQPFWLHLNCDDPTSVDWINHTPLLPDTTREALSGASSRPRITRIGSGALIILRGIDYQQENSVDPLSSLRVYITCSMIITTHTYPVNAVEEVSKDLLNNNGSINVADWLVDLTDALTDHANEFIDKIHGKIIDLEDSVLDENIPERSKIAKIRKQLIMLRRHLLPQRDVYSRLAVERLYWMTNDDRRRMQDIADRLGRSLDDLDACVSRTTVLSDEINAIMADATNRRTYTMSILAMLFLPLSFLTGLLGVNLGGIPGAESSWGFAAFCLLLFLLVGGIAWWLKRSRWL